MILAWLSKLPMNEDCYANNKSADQPYCCLDEIMPLVSESEISNLFPVAAPAGSSHLVKKTDVRRNSHITETSPYKSDPRFPPNI